GALQDTEVSILSGKCGTWLADICLRQTSRQNNSSAAFITTHSLFTGL
ncbi:MAG: hypothetical protein ACI9KM_001692, partial [Rubritalea sp.]